jgi:DNA-binding beta-propeller fold protein YncE
VKIRERIAESASTSKAGLSAMLRVEGGGAPSTPTAARRLRMLSPSRPLPMSAGLSPTNRRRFVFATLATLCTMAGGLFAGAPAHAEISHDYLSRLAEAPSPAPVSGPFGYPWGLTIASGNVYVADTERDTVDEFNASGGFVSQLVGAGVFEGGRSVAVNQATGEVYVADTSRGVIDVFSSSGEFLAQWNGEDTPSGSFGFGYVYVASDNSTSLSDPAAGDVYVTDVSHDVVDVFKPEPAGKEKYATQLTGTTSGNFGQSLNVAVDQATGNVLVVDEGAHLVDLFKPLTLGTYEYLQALSGTPAGSFGEIGGVAADATSGDIYVTDTSTRAVDEFDSSGAYLGHITGTPGGAFSEPHGVAVGPNQDVYVAESGAKVVDIFGPNRLVPDVTTGSTANLNATEATLNGTVNPDGVALTACQFEYGTSTSYGHAVSCAETPGQIGAGTEPVPVSVAITGLQPDTTYHYRLAATNANGTNSGQDQELTTAGPGVHGESADNLMPTSVTLHAQIDPHGADTTYYFQYGTDASYGNDVPAPPGTDIGSGEGDQGVSEGVQNLQPHTVYHYRVVAVNAQATSYGADQTVTTTLVPALPTYSTAPGLPDGRVYEQVSPTNKNGNGAGSGSGLATVGQSEDQYSAASADGNAVLFYGTGPMGTTSASGFNGYFVASRSAAGWTTRGVLPRPAGGTISVFSIPGSIGASSDLSHVVFNCCATQSTVFASATVGSQLYLSGSDPLVQPEWVSQPKIANAIRPDEGFNRLQGPFPVGSSSDLATVYFGYQGTLLEQDASRAPNAGRTAPGAAGLYEWSHKTLTPAGVLPDGSIDPFGAVPAAEPDVSHINPLVTAAAQITAEDLNNEVSTDGSRAFFVSPDPYFCAQGSAPCGADTPELYVRVTAPDGTQGTTLISKSAVTGQSGQPALHGPLQMPNPHRSPSGGSLGRQSQPYVYATPDGSHAFFESVDRLTDDAPADSSVKEYEFNVDTGSLAYLPGVADLAVQAKSAESGGPLGTSPILASSQDGATFMFLRYPPGGAPELDLWRNGTVTQLSRLPSSQVHFLDDLFSGAIGAMSFVGARATADGSAFMFATDSPLPGGFNNAPGYEQVYRYDTVKSSLSCVSCPPAGTTPSGDAAFSHADLLGTGLDLESWLNTTRGMSSDGTRIFFDTPDPLVPQDTNGVRDVYQWENGKVSLLSSGTSVKDSLFLDSSVTGNDAFFATTEGLAAGDTDNAYDVYDARVPRPGDIQPPSPAPCQGDVCQGPPRVPSLLAVSPSETFSGPGNPAPKVIAHSKPKKRKTCHKKGRKAKSHRKCGKKASTRAEGRRN